VAGLKNKMESGRGRQIKGDRDGRAVVMKYFNVQEKEGEI
jgi:hypothetical protein